MFSKRELEGYMMIDHRNSPGIENASIPIGRGRFFQSPTINCSHCERMVVLNPDRSRSRGYCPKCDKYVCDSCEAERVRSGVCRPFKQVIEEFMDNAAKGAIHG
jgi:hypothetical protein